MDGEMERVMDKLDRLRDLINGHEMRDRIPMDSGSQHRQKDPPLVRGVIPDDWDSKSGYARALVKVGDI